MKGILNKLSVIYFLRRKHLSCDLSDQKKHSRQRGEQVQRLLKCHRPSMFEDWWGGDIVNPMK